MAVRRKFSPTKMYNLFYNRYKLIALNMFKWENLPPNLKSRHIEKALYTHGKAFFYDDENLGLICLPCSYSSNFNTFGEGTIFNVHGFQTVTRKSLSDGICILNNDLGIQTDMYIEDYSYRMMEVEKSINANIKQQKYPYFIECAKNSVTTLETIFNKKEDGEPVIFGNKDLGLTDNLHVLGLNTPYVVDKLKQYQYELEREILTFLGINNTIEKKERLLTDEVNSNNNFVESNVELMYKARLEACDEINKRFNLDIKVTRNYIHETIENNDDEGDDDV